MSEDTFRTPFEWIAAAILIGAAAAYCVCIMQDDVPLAHVKPMRGAGRPMPSADLVGAGLNVVPLERLPSIANVRFDVDRDAAPARKRSRLDSED